MSLGEKIGPNAAFAALRKFARAGKIVERCDFCGAELSAVHQHLIGPQQRSMDCVCDACAILFGDQGETAYRRVPRRILHLRDFRLTDAQWEGLLIPIRLAFFFHNSAAGGIVAIYPSPAGPAGSPLDRTVWDEIARDNPILNRMSPDVEGLLVNKTGRIRRSGGSDEYFIAPIDECYRLAGLIRVKWRGLSGGEDVWNEIGEFFADLKSRSNEVQMRSGERPIA